MRRRPARLWALVMLCAGVAGLVEAQSDRRLSRPVSDGRRVALVIGNDRYAQMPLRNAVNDARTMSTALTDVGFEVHAATDATFKQLAQAIDRFIAGLRPGDVALAYYAGHGIQVEGENYLMPIDFDAKDEADVRYEGYSASRLADRMAGSGARLTMLVLDACRNNPFRSSRSGTRGLAAMNGASGSLIAFATAPGSTADDNPTAANGLFTTHLVAALKEPGLTVEQLFSRVRQSVHEASGRRQTPWLVSSVIGEFVFPPVAAAPPVTPSRVVDSDLRRREDLALYEAVKASTSIPLLEDYLRRFPDGLFRLAVEERIRALRAASNTPPPGSGTAAVPAPAPTRDTTPPQGGTRAGMRPGYLSRPSIAVRSSPLAVFEQPHAVLGQDGQTYLPFSVVLAPAVRSRGAVAIYVRAVDTAAPPSATTHAWDSVYVRSTGAIGTDGRVLAAMALRPGTYRLFVAIKPLERDVRADRTSPNVRTKAEQAVVEELAKTVNGAASTQGQEGDVVLLEHALSVPALRTGVLTTSSVIVASAVEPVTRALTNDEQLEQPYTFGTMRIVPIFGPPTLSRGTELQVMFWIYGAGADAAGKPNVTIEYEFHRETSEGVKYFNKTAPQQLNATTLPPEFSMAAGHQVPGSVVVPLASFEPGTYQLHIKVRDNTTRDAVGNEVRFTVVP